MLLNGKPVTSLDETDLVALVTAKTRESKNLDFKLELPGNSDSEKKKFLCDIAAFANTAGGCVIYGMDEVAGEPSNLTGIDGIDPDKETLRLQNIVLSGIEPRIIGITFHPVGLANGAYALIIGIPKSWVGPHMVTFQGASLFYARSAAGNYQLDVNELRQAFLLSDAIDKRIRDFRLDRISKIAANELPIVMAEGAKIVLHYIPVSAFHTAAQVDISFAADNYSRLEPICGGVSGFRFNIDGLLTFLKPPEDRAVSYVQLFRNGIVEAVDDYLLSKESDGHPIIPSVALEKAVVEASSGILGFQKRLGVEPPVFIFMTLLGVRGYSMAVNRELVSRSAVSTYSQQIDRDILLIPEISLNDYAVVDLFVLVRPIFDAVWNAAGWRGSTNYNEDGKWVAR